MMSNPSKILDYEVLAALGKGARSVIYAVQDADGQLYALKHVHKDGPEEQRFIDQAVLEHEVASQLDHPVLRKSFRLVRQRKIVKLSDVYVLLEMVDGHTLEKHKARSMVELVRLCEQVALGLMAMHDAGFIHADMKPNNVLVTDHETVKIIDFGQSCESGTVKPRIQGTPDYIAPEQVRRDPITARTDIFNLGATLYWLLTRRYVPTLLPRNDSVPVIGIRREDEFLPPAQINDQVPPALSALVMECVANDPQERPANMKVVHDRLGLAVAQLERNGKASLRQSG
jgi:serine/threonine-protein kinase